MHDPTPMLLQIRNLSKHFTLRDGRILRAVDGISLDIEQGTVLGLVGESGSGKSTLGRTLAGLLERTSGEILFRGEPLPRRYGRREFRRYGHEIQMVFQDPLGSLDPRMTVREIIAEPLRLLAPVPAAVERERVAQWLCKVGLDPQHMSRYPHELSGGQRQRVGIARALIAEPRLLICDEPVSALDVSVQAQVINLLLDLKQSMDLTLLFIAHDLAMVRHIADRMAVMYLGALVEAGPADGVGDRPAHPYTQALIASSPQADPQRERHRPHVPIVGEIPSLIDTRPGCRFAPRCPKTVDRCRSETPRLLPDAGEHRVACHLATIGSITCGQSAPPQ